MTPSPLTIGILGTGHLAHALAAPWARCGHRVTLGTRSGPLIQDAERIPIRPLSTAVAGADVVVLAVPWNAVDSVLTAVDADGGALSGVTLVDPINCVEHGIGRHLLEEGSVSDRVAARAPGARVVKAFNVHPAPFWATAGPSDTVVIASDDELAVQRTGRLVRDTGASPHHIGGIWRARQLEEFAGAVIALAFAGVSPRTAVPD